MNFRFKQFTIEQDRCAFKVGTDSVMLGAWAKVEGAKTILDIGTGSGVLALMMAQKTEASKASITAIDLEESAYVQARENAEDSPWKERIEVHHASLQDFIQRFGEPVPPLFDLIISNPPYFTNPAHATGTSLSNARNTDQLPFHELSEAVTQLLKPNGSFYLVLPTPEAKIFRKIAETHGLVLAHLLRVQTKPGESHEKRHLLLFQKSAFLYQEDILVIEEHAENGERNYTSAYRELTRDFYLNF